MLALQKCIKVDWKVLLIEVIYWKSKGTYRHLKLNFKRWVRSKCFSSNRNKRGWWNQKKPGTVRIWVELQLLELYSSVWVSGSLKSTNTYCKLEKQPHTHQVQIAAEFTQAFLLSLMCTTFWRFYFSVLFLPQRADHRIFKKYWAHHQGVCCKLEASLGHVIECVGESWEASKKN